MSIHLPKSLVFILLALVSLGAGAQSSGAGNTIMNRVLLSVPDARQPVRLARLGIVADIAGTVARTRVELVFRNPNDRVLEGELQFLLAEGQVVSGFALDINGHLRAASPVEKARGREVFEDIERRGADPALLERSVGNNFKLRVYPLPPRSERRVVLQLTETLTPGRDGRVSYRPPLALAETADRLDLELHMAAVAPRALTLDAFPGDTTKAPEGEGAVVRLDREAWQSRRGGPPAVLTWHTAPTAITISDRFDGSTFFYADVPVKLQAGVRMAPGTVVLIWDASGSGAARDHGKEFALLDAWFRKLGSVEVMLVIARDRAEVPRQFHIRGGDWMTLRKVLETVPYDGATNPLAWALPADLPADSVGVMFSDGLSNWGEGRLPIFSRPVYAVNAASSADTARLRALAEASSGRYLDLLRIPAAEGVAELGLRRPRLVALSSDGAEQLVAASAYPECGRLQLAGVMTRPAATVKLVLESASGTRSELAVPLRAAPENRARAEQDALPGLAGLRWAGLTLAGLEAEARLHRVEIRRLGQRFGLVSEEASLTVLESLDDYLRYNIEPPAGDLRLEYRQQMAGREARGQRERRNQVETLVGRFKERVKWWETDFPKGDLPPPIVYRPGLLERVAGALDNLLPGQRRVVSEQAPILIEERREMAKSERAAARPYIAPAPVPVPSRQVESHTLSIHLQKWQPEAPYAHRLREASEAERYVVYLDERSGHLNSTAFFLDAAEVFFDKGQTEFALRVLSNLAEMDLENRQILRVLAYRLQHAGLADLALPLLKRVRELAPDEPQSWRDLGLAYAAAGQDQAAVEALWEAASQLPPWRAGDIDLIAVGELSAIAARHPGLDLSRVDKRLQRNLPLALRAVLNWDMDATDIDLWVTDPNGDKVYYANPLSPQGGHITRDVTAGYGPEEFALRVAKPGRYTREA